MQRFVFLFALLLAGCGGAATTDGASSIPGSSWVLERIVDDRGNITRGGGQTVQFGRDGSVHTFSCNGCNGRYRLRGDMLEVDEVLACTRRACPTTEIQLERLLSGSHTAVRDGQYLVLTPVEGGETAQILFLPAVARNS